MRHFNLLALLIALALFAGCGGKPHTERNEPGTQGGKVDQGEKKDLAIGSECTKGSECLSSYCDPTTKKCASRPAPIEKKCPQEVTCKKTETCNSEGKCVENAPSPTQPSCDNIKCPNDNYQCVKGICEPQCSFKDFCGGGCCATGETCFENKCIHVEKPAGKENVDLVLCKTESTQTVPVWCEENQGCFKTKDTTHPYKCIQLNNECNEEEERYCKIIDYCDPEYKRCVNYEENKDGLCIFETPLKTDAPKILVEWKKSHLSDPSFDQVMATPIVANIIDSNGDNVLDDNDTSEILFVTFDKNRQNSSDSANVHNYDDPSILRVISAQPDSSLSQADINNYGNAKELWNSRTIANKFYSSGTNSPAVGDMTGDGKPNIVVDGFASQDITSAHSIYILEGDGTQVATLDITQLIEENYNAAQGWRSREEFTNHTGIQLVDLDGDGAPEIVADMFVFTYDKSSKIIAKKCVLKNASGVPMLATNSADFNGDGKQEIIAGSALFTYGAQGCTHVADTGKRAFGSAVANLLNRSEGRPEIVTAHAGKVYVDTVNVNSSGQFTRETVKTFDIPIDAVKATKVANKGKGSSSWINNRCPSVHDGDPIDICNGGGGIPNIADFDGDGIPEIGVAGRWYYVVFDVDGTTKGGDSLKNNILWRFSTEDYTSAMTSSSVFDFNGDGKAEVVYNDQDFLYILSGEGEGTKKDSEGYYEGKELIKYSNTSNTFREYPVIVDVNNDNHANIVVAANDYWHKNEGVMASNTGLRVLKAADNNWVPTRRIWNQFAYRVTNIHRDGTIPAQEKANWKQEWLNNHLQNVQKGNPFLAPNVVPVVQAIQGSSCDTQSTKKKIVFGIKNIGSRDVRPHTASYKVVAFKGSEEQEISKGENSTVINPGDMEIVTIEEWQIPSAWSSGTFGIKFILNEGGTLHECNSDDNVVTREGIKAGAPNLKVTDVDLDTSLCNGSEQKVKIGFKIKNIGQEPIPASSNVMVNIYGGQKDHMQLIHTLSINEEIPATTGEYTGTYEWDVSSLTNQSLHVKIVVDEENSVIECSEEDNVYESNQSIACYTLG